LAHREVHHIVAGHNGFLTSNVRKTRRKTFTVHLFLITSPTLLNKNDQLLT